MGPTSRAPSDALRKARLVKKQTKAKAKADAAKIEEKNRKAGGYGKAVVSIHDAPAGGIKNSPAYTKVLARCGGGKMPPPQDRLGAPIKGGFPLNKYPVNVLVDNQRVCWLPDDWAQVIKNTGPGGTYLGWMSPEGKFAYHRKGYPQAIHETLGRALTALDGINGIRREVGRMVSVKNDKTFLAACMTPSERKHVLPASKFHFAVISARRATCDDGIQNIMIVEALCQVAGVKPTWYVDAPSLDAYKALGLTAKVGGKLCPARNMALNDAAKKNLVCVEVSDDIAKWVYYDVAKQNLKGEASFDKANKALAGAKTHCITPLAAAQFMLAKMRTRKDKPKLAGVFPTNNAAMAMGQEDFSTANFILGDFFVAEPSSKARFDETMSLKEDYDYTCSHLKENGAVLRCNKMMVQARHSTNAGGAVATRDAQGKKERENIAILQRKWPGVFKNNVKRPNEVLMRWNCYGKTEATKPKVGKMAKSISKKISGKGKVSKKVIKNAKTKTAKAVGFNLGAKLKYTGKEAKEDYITKRCKKCDGKTIGEVLGTKFAHKDATKKYGIADLKYDLAGERLKMLGAKLGA
jgi:hypothetical protein